jgi:uncharacterized protein YfaS (alpha-2-macroglobulin family)
MSESVPVPPSSEILQSPRQRWAAIAVAAVLVIIAFVMLTMWQRPVPESQGIVYPINGQTITGDGFMLYSTFELNTAALAEALMKNGQKAELESIQLISAYVGNNFQYDIRLALTDGDTLSVRHDLYNQQKDSLGEVLNYPPLPHDLSWPYSSEVLFIDRVQETDNSEETSREFEVFFSGSERSEDLIVFSLGFYVDPVVTELEVDQQYLAENSQYRLDNCNYGYDGLQAAQYDWSVFRIRPFRVIKETAQSTIFSVPTAELKDHACFFVALQHDAKSGRSFLATQYREPAAALALDQLFNPDLDFKSQISIRFNTPFLDFRKKRESDDELAYRVSFKKKLANLIALSPAVEIIPEDIVLYPDRAEIPVRLAEKKHYQFILNAGQDVFGDTFVAQTLEIETGELKYLGLRQKETQSVFMSSTPPMVEIVHAGVTDPTVKICSVDTETYAKIELMTSRSTVIPGSTAFLKEGIDALPVKKCQEQLVVLKKEAYRTAVDMTKLIGQPANLGQYYMTFSFQGERQVTKETPVSTPIFFAVVDSHITMKFSRNGRALFWVNDLSSGKGVPGVTLQSYQNTFTGHEEQYNDATGQWDYTYFNPLEKNIYSDPIKLGETDADGFLEVDLGSDDYLNAFDTWYRDPQYRSLLVNASGENHFSMVVSKWNSGIADWNFGYYPEYLYEPSKTFSAHLYPDRKLYEPGETVHLKAIVREQGKTLTIPTGKSFAVAIMDSNGNAILEQEFTPNAFGSILVDLDIKDDAPLGIYRADIKMSLDQEFDYIATTNFNVEQFQKPTFKVEVAVNSSDLENEQFSEPTITETDTGWGYRYKTYEKNLNLSADVDASYYAGGKVANAPFTYVVFKQYYYDPSFWSDCYYGCYWEPSKDYYSEGSGVLDGDGRASMSIPVTHQTSWDDYRYIVQFAVTAPSAQKVAGSGSVIVKISDSLRQGNPYVNIQLEVDKKFVPAGESIILTVRPERKWSSANEGRYQIILKHRQYSSKNSKQVGGAIVPQVDFEDEELEKVEVSTRNFDLHDDGTLSKSFRLTDDGDYSLVLEEVDPANGNFSTNTVNLYAYAKDGVTNAPVVADNKITVLAEKTSYHLEEKAQILVRFPFADGKALVTIEKNNVVSKELIDFKGNVLFKEFEVDDTFVPNAYISVIGFKPAGDSKIQPEYKVGYTEIVVDKTDKMLKLDLKTNAEQYSPRDKVTLDIVASDRNDKPVQTEVSVAVVDEALISILGNIDLDILPKFFTKIVFQTHTALTNVAMLKQLYFARKGTVGGSGGKDGGDAITTRTNFKNTAFYAGSVVTDANGKAQLTFDLPDNIGEFRIITIGNTKNNIFGASEKTIAVRQEVTVEETFPMIVRSGDDMRVGATVYNNSAEQKKIFMSLDADGLTLPENQRQEVTVKAGEREFVTWRVSVETQDLASLQEVITYTITAVDEKTQKGDRLEKTVPFASVPLLANRLHLQDDFQTKIDHVLKTMADIDPLQSFVELSFSTTILAGIEKIISSLLVYPYGCIEQTISSTLPNAIVKKFQDVLKVGIDEKVLQKNLDEGVKRFASMQTADGGFAYWPGESTTDAHITPYAVLAIVEMRDLGVDIPPDMIDRGRVFIEEQVQSLQGDIPEDRLSQLVQELHALSRLDSSAFATARTLLQNRLGQLSTHEKIVYGLALAKKDVKNYRQEIEELLPKIDLKKAGDSERNWYWDEIADKALYTQLLIRLNPQHQDIPKMVKELYLLDLGSYYYSTQAKIQSFIAFAEYIEKVDSPKKSAVGIQYQLGKTSGKVDLNDRTIFKKMRIPFAELQSQGGDLLFKASSSKADQRVYTDLLIYQIPKDPTTIKAQQDKGVTVKRQYFKMGKVKETDNGWWKQSERDLAAVSGNSFKLGETYLVRLTVHFDQAQHQIALESYLPAGLKLVNTAFLTEQTQVNEDRWNWPFDHQEFRADRFFASAKQFYTGNEDVTIDYYVRANIAGTFQEPPVSVYPMYRPEIEGHTAFGKIVIEE